jgi:3-oxoadipate enol-lactonase
MRGVVDSDGASLAYSIEGVPNAPVLMLAHSLGTDARLWDAQIPDLASRYRVLRYDSRGHGGSTAAQGDYTLARLGRDALQLIDALGMETVSFCGISLGGMVGQWLASHAPDRLASLALCNTSAYMGPPESWDARIAAVRAGGMAAVENAVIQRWFTADFLASASFAIAHARSMLLATTPVGYAGCCAAIRDMDMRNDVGTGRPTLIIAGLHDQATPPSHSQALLSRFPAGRLAILPAAHLSNLEQPRLFTDALLGFLAEFTTEA